MNGEVKKLYNDPVFIGKIIKNARKKAKLTQAQLAEILGMSDKSIGGIENGNQFPLVKNFLSMIEVLNIKLSDFGIGDNNKSDTKRDKLLKMIYSATPKQIEVYSKTISFIENIMELK